MNILSLDQVLSKNIHIPLRHAGESQWGGHEWIEEDFNYRLNICDYVLYAVVDGEVVGHLGIQDETVRAVFVDEAHRGQAIAQSLYEEAFVDLGYLFSDDAREPQDTHIWEKMKEKYHQISYLAGQDQYLFKS